MSPDEKTLALAREYNLEFADDILAFARKVREEALAENALLVELAWGIIANASGGNWDLESKDWQTAAAKWRDDYHHSLKRDQPERESE